MSFKKILAFIVLVLVVILITFGIFFYLNKEGEVPVDINGNPLPIGGENGTGNTRDTISRGDNTNITLTDNGAGPSSQTIEAKREKRLRKLYDEPIAGALTYLSLIHI